MKNSLKKLLLGAGILHVGTLVALATDQTVSGNLTVTGVASIQGNTTTFGTQGSSSAGLGMTYSDADVDTLTYYLNRNPASWLWAHAATIAAMRLTSNHELVLYKGDGTTGGITLTPASSTLSLGGATLYRDAGGALRTDGGLTVGGSFTVPVVTATSGTITGGSSGLSLNAGGTNQNVTITPSGSGNTLLLGNVGIGTSNPTALLSIGQLGSADGGQARFNQQPLGYASGSGMPVSTSAVVQSISLGAGTAINASGLAVGNQLKPSVYNGSASAAGLIADIYDSPGNSVALSSVTGTLSMVTHSGSANADLLQGMYASITNNGAATSLIGIRSRVINQAGSVNANVSNLSAFQSNLWNIGPTSAIGSYKGLYIAQPANSGTITNTYGVYIDNLSVGTQTNRPYSFYAADVNALNYFGGPVRIGSSAALSDGVATMIVDPWALTYDGAAEAGNPDGRVAHFGVNSLYDSGAAGTRSNIALVDISYGGAFSAENPITIQDAALLEIGKGNTTTFSAGTNGNVTINNSWGLYNHFGLRSEGLTRLGGNGGFAPAWGASGAVLQVSGPIFGDTSTVSGGTVPMAVFTSFARPMLGANNANVTTANAATVYIEGEPGAWANQTLTNSWGLWNGGTTRLDGALRLSSLPNATMLGTDSTGKVIAASGNFVSKSGDTLSGALSATALTTSGGSVTGGANGLTLAAGGTNQNVTIAPSGTGNAIVQGNLGLGTATPTATVDVATAPVMTADVIGVRSVLNPTGGDGTKNEYAGYFLAKNGRNSPNAVYGIYAEAENNNFDAGSYGVYGVGDIGVYGRSNNSGTGVFGFDADGGIGVFGTSTAGGTGVLASSSGGGSALSAYGQSGSSAIWASGTSIFLNGSVGIGTYSPLSLLHVNGAGAAIRLSDQGTGGSTLLLNSKFSNTAGLAGVQATGALVLAPNNAEAIRLTTAGNVGIGVSSPAQKLDVAGIVRNQGVQISNLTGAALLGTDGNGLVTAVTPGSLGLVSKAGDTMTGALSASGLTATSGTINGGASGLTLSAGGSNQNVTIAPTGSGMAMVSGRANVSGALTVGGGATVTGTLTADAVSAANISGGTVKAQGSLQVTDAGASYQALITPPSGVTANVTLTLPAASGTLARTSDIVTNASQLTTGTLALANGGTGASTPAAAAANLKLGTTDTPSFAGVTLTNTSKSTAAILIAPQGDLSMGEFTDGPQPSVQ